MKNRMLKPLCWMLALSMCILLIPLSAAAEDISGSMQSSVTFYVKVNSSNAYIMFNSSAGLARVEQHNTFGKYTGIGEEQTHGFYEITASGPSGEFNYIWAPSARAGKGAALEKEPSFGFYSTGTYKVTVRPLSPDEASQYWIYDRISSWTQYAKWTVSIAYQCETSYGKPSVQGGGNGSFGGGGSMGGGSRDGSGSGTGNRRDLGGAREMGVPQIGSRVYRAEEMNMTIFWVQTQLKATGRWYQGDNWDCTGSLGSHTISEIRSFMSSLGYSSHSGNVDQSVINELCSYLGNRLQPVYVGGIYDYMSSIMQGGSSGSMNKINSNLIDGVPHVTTGARWIQTCLKKIGYYSSGIDGMYGEGTERAVNAFQRDYGWVERNYVTLGVARAMLEAYYARGGNLSQLP